MSGCKNLLAYHLQEKVHGVSQKWLEIQIKCKFIKIQNLLTILSVFQHSHELLALTTQTRPTHSPGYHNGREVLWSSRRTVRKQTPLRSKEGKEHVCLREIEREGDLFHTSINVLLLIITNCKGYEIFWYDF